ncbi:Uncharacterised protein [Mycobacteroides abscessus subsp. abscessus]|nr:Uncharacterised protein [Mycobacteroides abscessus subsp. abscessus]
MARRHRHFGAIDHVSVGNFSGKGGDCDYESMAAS